jgi:hypothetical protein
MTDAADEQQTFSDTIPDGAKENIVVSVPAVPISRTVQYTLSVVDGNGQLIGKGQSGVLVNNDTATLPTAVSIQCHEQFKAINASTTFVRQDTLQYDVGKGHYHWVPNVPVTAVASSLNDAKVDLLELNTSSVGTVSGMMGTIWRSKDNRYWVRNTPTVEDQSNPGLHEQFAGPYTTRPYLVYDRLNPDLVNGNNFLLEPMPTQGYLVRRLKLSDQGGALTWEKNQAWGQILDDITAVTYHPSGFIACVTEDTSKLHMLEVPRAPVADNTYPTLSQAFSGPGERQGLTTNPTGVTCTIDGTILVLENGSNRMQAFDVNGNPRLYFPGDDGEKTSLCTLAGSDSDTRLGIAVDGAHYIYVLSYSNSGTAPSDYRVDIHAPDGTFIVAPNNVNVGAFDVDYWRNLFTVNYTPLTTTDGGTYYIDPAIGRQQPSLSIFVPSNKK